MERGKIFVIAGSLKEYENFLKKVEKESKNFNPDDYRYVYSCRTFLGMKINGAIRIGSWHKRKDIGFIEEELKEKGVI